MGILSELQPNRVFHYFEEISAIPRGSYHTEAVSDYCAGVARSLGLSCVQDAYHNCIIKKPASEGCEGAPAVMLQGHLDMVWEAEPDYEFDFEHRGLDLLIQDGFVTADRTTLGGDDGFAVACCLAILEDDSLVHPALEVVFTTEEEVGMDGAIGLDTSDLKAKYLINLDSEDEGILTCGCAGGSTIELHRSMKGEAKSGLTYRITCGGLLGGHSGCEIDKGRASANRLMAYVLYELGQKTEYDLIGFHGGTKHNAIPVQSVAEILIPSEEEVHKVRKVLATLQEHFMHKYEVTDPEIYLGLEPYDATGTVTVVDRKEREEAITCLLALPDGLLAMSHRIENLPELSCNMAVVSLDAETCEIELSNRSGEPSSLKLLEMKERAVALGCGFDMPTVASSYPGWQYKEDSLLRERMVTIYQTMFLKEMKVEVIHAGLECGIIASKMPELDIVSMGPNLFDIHTPKERMEIESVQRTYAYLIKVLEVLGSEGTEDGSED